VGFGFPGGSGRGFRGAGRGFDGVGRGFGGGRPFRIQPG
jgi:hypothetical protein